ncbi:Caspase-like domain [Trinorchestia longiramus]|nr:Caspase-like domain [Trinorchestia longiramus]
MEAQQRRDIESDVTLSKFHQIPVQKKNSGESRSTKASNSSTEFQESFKRSKFSLSRAFRSKNTLVNQPASSSTSPTSPSQSSVPSIIPSSNSSTTPADNPPAEPSVLRTIPPSDSPTTLADNPPAEPSVPPTILSSNSSTTPADNPSAEPSVLRTIPPSDSPTTLADNPPAEPSVPPTIPPSDSSTTLADNPTAPPSSNPLSTPAISVSSGILNSERASSTSLEHPAEILASSLTSPLHTSFNEANSTSKNVTVGQVSAIEKEEDCLSMQKRNLPLQDMDGARRKLSEGNRPIRKFSGPTDEELKTFYLSTSTTALERPRSINNPTCHTADAASMNSFGDASDSDDDVSERSQKNRKGSLPAINYPSSFLPLKQEEARKTTVVCRKPMAKENLFTVKYVRVHGPEDRAYKNDSKPRGLIFMKNFEKFSDDKYAFRHGSLNDYNNLLDLFQQMGYRKSQKYCESGFIKKEKLLSDLKAFSKLDHNMYDSCIIILMSHGVKDKTFVCSDGENVDLMEVYSLLNNTNCQHLRNKPKIFILQFCRPQISVPSTRALSSSRHSVLECSGIENDFIELRIRDAVNRMAEQLRSEFRSLIEKKFSNVPAIQASTSENEHFEGPEISDVMSAGPEDTSTPNVTSASPHARYDSSSSPYPVFAASKNSSGIFTFDQQQLMQDAAKLEVTDEDIPAPDYSDMYSIFSTNSGGVAYRHPRKGSLLVQAICQVFSSHAYQDDIEELVRKVSKWMQQEIAKDDPVASHRHTVVERVNNGLDKAFYFNPTILKNVKRNTTNFW